MGHSLAPAATRPAALPTSARRTGVVESGHLLVAEGRIEPAGFDEVVAGVQAQHCQTVPASEAFPLAHKAGAEPSASGRWSNEETLHLSDPLRQQAQARATQDRVTLTGNEEHAGRG